jgi:LPXTG-motif cell wall-anchored protein
MRTAWIIIIFLIALPSVSACKDVIVTNDATAGDYALFMKVRDPSRPGPQVLFMVEPGYTYSYHHPWRGFEIPYEIEHKLLGVATRGDTPPDIIKAGMLLSDAGIAYGDADSPTYWVNPTQRAWDDFDWLRYAAQTADTVDEAVDKLDEVVAMHAPGIGENLFVADYNNAYVMEADALHSITWPVEDIATMSNYPKQSWPFRWLKRIFIASDFDRVFEGSVRRWQTARIGGLCGVRVTAISDDAVSCSPVPGREKVTIPEGEGRRVGPYYVFLDATADNTARIRMSYEYCEWERLVLSYLRQRYGAVSIADLITLSRWHTADLDGLRGFCEAEEKATMIFKLSQEPDLCMGWFAPDQCVTPYVPVHICDTAIFSAYENGDSADRAAAVLAKYGHGTLNVSAVESVFILENERVERLAVNHSAQMSTLLTVIDTSMQEQAGLLQQMLLTVDPPDAPSLLAIWNNGYYLTLQNMCRAIDTFPESIRRILAATALSMGTARADIQDAVNGDDAQATVERAEKLFSAGRYRESVSVVADMFRETDESIFGVVHPDGDDDGAWLVLAGIAVLAVAGFVVVRLRRNRRP